MDSSRHTDPFVKHLLLLPVERKAAQENIRMGKLGISRSTEVMGWLGDQEARHILKSLGSEVRMEVTQQSQFMEEGGRIQVHNPIQYHPLD